ncbi:hypothetical protein Ancab_029951 [Ancistrocladus abbreviatus]
MFFLSRLEHKFRLPPHLLDLPLEDAIKRQIDSFFLDKVIAKYGLCISLYDIKSIDGGFILPNEGSPTYKVDFRMVMFRPFVGEVISARLKESNRNGLRLSVGFFDDIHIPAYLLPSPSHPEPHPLHPEDINQVRWVWLFNETRCDIHEDDEIRFRVVKVEYPPIPLEQQECSKPFAPMIVTGTLDADGLGPVSWWV